MNIAGIDYESVKDGVGVRTVIYVSGCSHNCYRCHNPQTHDINYGISFTEELQNEIIENIRKRPFISGLTWSGGDPLHGNNINDVLSFTNKFRLLFPHKSIWLYTGYEWETIMDYKPAETDEFDYIEESYIDGLYEERKLIISKCDVLIDGKYIDSQRDITLPYRGSNNQRVINIQESLKKGEIILWKC